MSTYFVTGIGTGIGKTVISAILTEKYKADYWKPIQTGIHPESDEISDTRWVSEMVSNSFSRVYKEKYVLKKPVSPHEAAKSENVYLELGHFQPPAEADILIVEGAGGLMVPLNETHLMIDLISHLNGTAILVSSNYLGSINHTLMSVALLKEWNIPLEGIVFSGIANLESESIIAHYTKVPILGKVPFLPALSKASVADAGKYIHLTTQI